MTDRQLKVMLHPQLDFVHTFFLINAGLQAFLLSWFVLAVLLLLLFSFCIVDEFNLSEVSFAYFPSRNLTLHYCQRHSITERQDSTY